MIIKQQFFHLITYTILFIVDIATLMLFFTFEQYEDSFDILIYLNKKIIKQQE